MREPTADRHPDRALTRLVAGEATAGDREAVVRHLLDGCAWCSARLEAALGAETAEPDALTAAVDRAVERFPALEARVAAERAEANALVARLKDLPPARQRLLIANVETARTRAVCERLMDESRALRGDDIASATRLADLAVLASERFAGADAEELRARALTERANARRIGGDFSASNRDLAAAEKLLAIGTADPLVRAQLLAYSAALAIDRRRLDEADSLLKRAAALFSRYEDVPGLARVLIQIGMLHSLRSTPREGIEPVLQALRILSTDHSALRLTAVINLVYLVAESGDAQEAAVLITRVKPLIERRGSLLTRLGFAWLSARVERDLGNVGAAEEALDQLREEYLANGFPQYAAVVSLDLASLYAHELRLGDLSRVALVALDLCRHLGIDREALAALGLLAQTASAGRAFTVASALADIEKVRRAVDKRPVRDSSPA